ncbi:MAG: superoxide dismutase [Fe] [Bdellovibrionaceae bacterium]|nr:superoxide dismutase [Fe] [Pseudobdellovibrionaceae bacterium]
MPFTIAPLPFEKTALEPHISSETLDYHYDKHHQAYLTKLNAAVKGTDLENKSLEDLIASQTGGIFNNAAQVWNHSFYWNCLSPQGGGAASGKIKDLIEKKWSSWEKFKEAFSTACATNFGSGWTWLVQNADGNIDIVSTSNAGCPLTNKQTPLLTCDVWEHAYYVDYRNARPKYIEAFWNIVNWDFVNSNLK